MTPAEVAFALETQELTLAAASACMTAALVTGTVATIHATSARRPRGRGWFTISILITCTLGLFGLAGQFWSLP